MRCGFLRTGGIGSTFERIVFNLVNNTVCGRRRYSDEQDITVEIAIHGQGTAGTDG